MKNISRNISQEKKENTRGIEPSALAEYKIFQHIERNSYFVGEFQVFTMPLEKSGYSVAAGELGQMIFVSSKLPKAERSKVVSELIQKRKSKEEVNNNEK